ncbi:MAG: hypothetical protein H6728_16910 [Myxococcales bacterium]|nr:hypothetical protein [Myxococcales bacterium]MCB9644754.1 hypothetical protein [Myxococcales bacterium]
MLKSMTKWFLLAAVLSFNTGCQRTDVPPPRIDLAQVNDAFQSTGGATFSQFMQNLEMKVNEIYLKDDFVMLDARRPRIGELQIYGYVDKDKVPGFDRFRDDLLFKIVQEKGPGRFYYRLESGDGYVFARQSYRASTPGMGFLAAYTTLALLSMWPRYYTPYSRVVVIRRYRTTYRRSPGYAARRRRYAAYSKKTRSARASARRMGGRRGGRGGGKW